MVWIDIKTHRYISILYRSISILVAIDKLFWTKIRPSMQENLYLGQDSNQCAQLQRLVKLEY